MRPLKSSSLDAGRRRTLERNRVGERDLLLLLVERDLVGRRLGFGGGGERSDGELLRAMRAEDLRQRQRVERGVDGGRPVLGDLDRRRLRARRRRDGHRRRRRSDARGRGHGRKRGCRRGDARRRPFALGVQLGEHPLRRRVLRIDLQHHLAHRDRLEQKAALGVAGGGDLELAHCLRHVGHLAERFAGALMPIGIGRLGDGDLQVEHGGLGVLLLLDCLRRLVLDLTQIDFGSHTLAAHFTISSFSMPQPLRAATVRRRRAQPRGGDASRGVHRRRSGRSASQQDAERGAPASRRLGHHHHPRPSGAASRQSARGVRAAGRAAAQAQLRAQEAQGDAAVARRRRATAHRQVATRRAPKPRAVGPSTTEVDSAGPLHKTSVVNIRNWLVGIALVAGLATADGPARAQAGAPIATRAVGPMVQVFPTSVPPGATEARLEAARGEWEPFQIVVHAAGAPLKGVRAEATALRGAGRAGCAAPVTRRVSRRQDTVVGRRARRAVAGRARARRRRLRRREATGVPVRRSGG